LSEESSERQDDEANGLRALSFSEQEYRTRLEKVQKAMAARGLDALLAHSLGNICYLTGFESIYPPKYYLALIPAAGAPTLLVQDFEMHNARITAWTRDNVAYEIHHDEVEAAARLLLDRGYGQARLGVEQDAMGLTVAQYHRLTESLPKAAWMDPGGLVERVRLIKSEAEIEYIRRASVIASDAMRAGIEQAASGKTDNQVAVAMYDKAIGGGSEYMCLDPIVTVGRRSGVPHTSHRRVKIKDGDAILMEIGACVHRYTGVTMRSVVIAREDDKIKRMAQACIRSVEALIENIKPGVPACKVAAEAKKALGREGQEFLWHGYYGYSIGLGFQPDWNDCAWSIMEGNDQPLETGMVLHCNTSLRDVGAAGVACGETVAVTEKGCSVLTDVSRKLFVK
jgi:Xaa-Pro dipeptidase